MIIESIFSSEVVILAIVITGIAIGLKAVLAVLTHGTKNYDPKLTVVSVIIGFLVSIQIVVVSLEHLPVDASASTYLTIIASQILAVMGVDSGAKKVGQKIMRKGEAAA